jgi:hypothetical protein
VSSNARSRLTIRVLSLVTPGGRRAQCAAPPGHRRRGVRVAGRHPNPARATGPAGRRSDRPSPLASTETFDLHHGQSRRLQCPCQPHSVATGAFQCDHDPGTGRMVDDPGQCGGETALVVADAHRGDADAAGAISSRAWVSPPTTASTTSASMGIPPRVSFQGIGS